MATKNRGEDVAWQTFKFCIKFFPSRAMLVDGSTQDIERDMVVKWEVELEHVDPQELERMGEAAVRNLVEKMGRGWFGDQTKKFLCYDLKNGKASMLGLREGNRWLMKSMCKTVGQAKVLCF